MKIGMDIRKKLEEALGEPLIDRDWDTLCKQHTELLQVRNLDINRLTGYLRDYMAYRPRPYKERPPEFLNIVRGRVQNREEAMSILIAQAAGRDRFVIDFRESVLKDGLLRKEDVEVWIKEQGKRDGRPSCWVEIALSPKEWAERFKKPYITLHPRSGDSYDQKLLEYLVPEDDFIRRVAVASGGVLDKLRQVGNILADRCRWWPVQATIFILTGSIPLWPAIRTTADHMTKQLLRIVLDIDATTPPRIVADTYGRARKAVLEGQEQRRPRALSEKHLRLAVFLGDRPEGESWRDRFNAWNRATKKQGWDYRLEHIRNFQRDARQALERLLPPWTLEGIFP